MTTTLKQALEANDGTERDQDRRIARRAVALGLVREPRTPAQDALLNRLDTLGWTVAGEWTPAAPTGWEVEPVDDEHERLTIWIRLPDGHEAALYYAQPQGASRFWEIVDTMDRTHVALVMVTEHQYTNGTGWRVVGIQVPPSFD